MTEAEQRFSLGVDIGDDMPPRRRDQMVAIKSIIPERDGYLVRYDWLTDAILIGNYDLAFAMLGVHLDRPDYLDNARASFAALVEAVRQFRETPK